MRSTPLAGRGRLLTCCVNQVCRVYVTNEERQCFEYVPKDSHFRNYCWIENLMFQRAFFSAAEALRR